MVSLLLLNSPHDEVSSLIRRCALQRGDRVVEVNNLNELSVTAQLPTRHVTIRYRHAEREEVFPANYDALWYRGDPVVGTSLDERDTEFARGEVHALITWICECACAPVLNAPRTLGLKPLMWSGAWRRNLLSREIGCCPTEQAGRRSRFMHTEYKHAVTRTLAGAPDDTAADPYCVALEAGGDEKFLLVHCLRDYAVFSISTGQRIDNSHFARLAQKIMTAAGSCHEQLGVAVMTIGLSPTILGYLTNPPLDILGAAARPFCEFVLSSIARTAQLRQHAEIPVWQEGLI